MFNFKMKVKKVKKIFFKKNTENDEPNISYQTIKNTLFYCILCSKLLRYSELIDGSICCHCEKDLFLIPWNEFIKNGGKTSAKKSSYSQGYLP